LCYVKCHFEDFNGMSDRYTYDTGTDKDLDPEAVREFFDFAGAGRHTAVVCTLALYPNAVNWRRRLASDENHEEDALHIACENGHAHIAEILLDAKADIESQNWGSCKSTPLLAAVNAHSGKTVALLLARGADANKPDDEGYAPLLYAVCAGQADIAEALLKNGASPDATGGRGTPALGFAATGGDADMIRLLVKYGARPEVRDSDGNDVLTVARDSGNPKVAELIVQEVWKREKALKEAFDRAVEAMAEGTKTSLRLRRPLKLKAVM
jgi:ankyrin repeat protein